MEIEQREAIHLDFNCSIGKKTTLDYEGITKPPRK